MKLKLEQQIEMILSNIGVDYEKEYVFARDIGRKWRFDYAIRSKKVAIEIDGAIWTQGRHTRGSGYARDCEKFNTATIKGWKVLHYTSENIHQAENEINEVLAK